jgi:hypothetical protein
MNGPRRTPEENPTSPTAEGSNLGATLLQVAWFAILLGVVMEALILLLAAGVGIFPDLQPIAAAFVQKISWSVLVCVGIAIGTAASSARAPLMGLLGFLAAPIAFDVARTLHQGTAKALEISGAEAAGPSVLLLALIKGIEYACLGAAIGWIGQRSWGGLGAHASVGLAVGIIFGGAILALTYSATSPPPPATDLIPQGVDEILFPVGCALVLFSAEALGKRSAR